MKRLILLAASILVMLSTQKANAQNFFAVNNDGDTIYYNITSSTPPLTVEVTVGDENYTGDITIPESVTNGGNTYSVTAIRDSAFIFCPNLISAIIPNSVTTIGNYAFFRCNNLTSITIGISVMIIGNYAFAGCGLTSVSIPDSVTTIGGYAFFRCYDLTSVIISNSVITIGEEAFSDCTGLTSVTIGNSVTTIGESAFYLCTSLAFITIPNSVRTIGESAFTFCSALTSIDVEPDNPNYCSNDGVLFNKNKTILICCPAGKTGSYTIPNSVTTIRGGAFFNCSGLTGILVIPNSVTKIEGYTFHGCSGLISITIPDSVTTIGNYAFSDCSNLTSVNIPNSTTTIESLAFLDCRGLTSVTIPNSVTTIGMSAFSGCSGLTEIYVKAEVPPSLSLSVFYYVSDTIPLYVPCSKESVYKNAPRWDYFANIIDNIPFDIIAQSNDTAMGIANITEPNTCANNNTAVIEAIANAGYRFLHWNDGNTENPRTVTVTQNTTFTATFGVETGITDIKASTLSLYPNPATDNISIILPENVSQAVFTVYDMQGKVLIRQEVSSKETVAIDKLASGIYIYNVRTSKQNYQGKLIRK